jgi:hypothetical protein
VKNLPLFSQCKDELSSNAICSDSIYLPRPFVFWSTSISSSCFIIPCQCRDSGLSLRLNNKQYSLILIQAQTYSTDRIRDVPNNVFEKVAEGGERSVSRPGRALPPGKGPPVPIVQEIGWAPEPVWTQRLEEKSFRLCRGSNLDRPVRRHHTDWATRLTDFPYKLQENEVS